MGSAAMKLTRYEDIEAPISFVYGALADFDHWERMALRRGAEVTRLDTLPLPGPGMIWNILFDFRGRRRSVDLQLTALDPGQSIALDGQGTSMSGKARLDLVEMGPKRMRLAISMEIEARTLASRLFLHSLRFASAKINRKFQERTSHLATDLEERFRRSGKR